jgi:hypothetical protein
MAEHFQPKTGTEKRTVPSKGLQYKRICAPDDGQLGQNFIVYISDKRRGNTNEECHNLRCYEATEISYKDSRIE